MKTVLKSLVMFVAVLGMFMGLPGNSQAITNGQPDEDRHPYVGGVIFYGQDDNLLWFCSGALISPTVVLTAGHCTVEEAGYALVTFDPGNDGNYTFTLGLPHAHPSFCIGCGQGRPGFDTHDVGVVVLSEAVIMDTYAQPPSVGLVDTLPNNTDVTIVGYGFQMQTRGIPPHEWVDWGVRIYAPSRLIPSNDVIGEEFVKLTANPGQGKGGVCFGDSGGPDLLYGTDTILSINSFGNNYNCTGINYSYRIDTPDALSFIGSFLSP